MRTLDIPFNRIKIPMRTLVFCLCFGFVLSACQSTPESSEATPPESDAGMTTVTSAAPDPENPTSENNAVPADWSVRLDKADANVVIGDDSESADIFFVNMVPGWHITTGPAAIFHHDGSTASGDYTAEAIIHLFNPGERREGFGLIIGGEDLDGENQAYDYFLIRNSGEFLIKRRRGEETENIQPWTASDHIVRYTDPEVSSVKNVLSVEVAGESVMFKINGETVAQYAKDAIKTDGKVGIRVNHALNLHVSDLSVM